MKTPRIGEIIELFVNNEWKTDWLTQKRFDHMVGEGKNAKLYVESGIWVWGGIQKRWTDSDVWRIKQYSSEEIKGLSSNGLGKSPDK